MNLSKFLVAALVSLLAPQSFASGCGGLYGTEEGAFIEHKTVRGSFTCRAVNKDFLCSFFSEVPNEYFVTNLTKVKPPTNVLMDLGVDVFEATSYDDCSGQAVPGTLSKSYVAGTVYEIFIPKD